MPRLNNSLCNVPENNTTSMAHMEIYVDTSEEIYKFRNKFHFLAYLKTVELNKHKNNQTPKNQPCQKKNTLKRQNNEIGRCFLHLI